MGSTSPLMSYIQQLAGQGGQGQQGGQQQASSVPMQDPGLRYQYAPPYSPQRTDPDYEQNWQRSPQYDPPPDDTLLGQQRYAAQGGGLEYQPLRNDPGKARVPPDFMYDQRPVLQNTPGVASQPQAQAQPSAQEVAAFRREQARGIEQQANVPQDRAAIIQGMTYGPQQLRGQQHLLPQYQSLGNIRPLGPGEYIQHNDPVTGKPQISSEETITVPYGQGKWAVLPSLWMVDGKAMVVDADTATQFAQQSGLNWPQFNSESEGNAWADQREQTWYRSGGRTDTQPPLWSRQFPSRQ